MEADEKSTKFIDRLERRLNSTIFQNLSKKVLSPEIDLFASGLNFQIKLFISGDPDPEAMATGAFTVGWNRWIIYACPPFLYAR